jgi:hypothetical protein
MGIDWTNLFLGGLLIAVVLERWLANGAIAAARREVQTAAYWKRAYEMLVEQTGRDLNDGLGHDPRKTQPKANRSREG